MGLRKHIQKNTICLIISHKPYFVYTQGLLRCCTATIWTLRSMTVVKVGLISNKRFISVIRDFGANNAERDWVEHIVLIQKVKMLGLLDAATDFWD